MSLSANENSEYYAIPIAVLIGWVFSMIEGIGLYMDSPWQNNRNVVPTNAISRMVEIDVRTLALMEDNAPVAIKPIEGALY